MRTWQIPISTPSSRPLAHFFHERSRTDRMDEALCGLPVNPGFARRAPKKAKRCVFCERARVHGRKRGRKK